MSKHNSRKEPTFGEPTVSQEEIDFSESVEQIHLPKVSLSQNSKQKPNYTFSPVLKRPAEIAKDFASFEEMSMLKKEQELAEQALAEQALAEKALAEKALAEQALAEQARREQALAQQALQQQRAREAAEQSKIQQPSVAQASAPQRPASARSGLAFSPIVEEDTSAKEPEQAVYASGAPAAGQSDFERVIPASGQAVVKEPAEGKSSTLLRLLLVLLILLTLALLFFLLKPSNQRVDIQAQPAKNSLPIEFRPLNDEEAKRAEANANTAQPSKEEIEAQARLQAQQQIEQARIQVEAQLREKQQAEQQAMLQAQQLQAQQAKARAEAEALQARARAEAEAQARLQAQQARARAEAEAQAQAQAQAQAKLQAQQQAKARAEAEAQARIRAEAEAQARLQAQQFKASSPAQPKTQTEPAAPSRNNSVIYQPETPAKPADRVERKAVKTAQADPTRAQQNELDKLVKQLGSVEQKQAVRQVAAEPSVRVFVVKRGQSVMQLFREYHLDIADVNAMNRANRILSNIKAGERLTIRLDKNNHVAEMLLSSGGRYVRQANGNYVYGR